MAPPTIAPPMIPPATAAPRPRCALAGVAGSGPAVVATATKATNVFFMSWALLEMAPSVGAGVVKVTHTPYSKLAISLKNSQQSIQSKRSWSSGPKKRFFQAKGKKVPENALFPGTPEWFEGRYKGSAANPHAANPPAIAIPETLALPDAAAIIVVAD